MGYSPLRQLYSDLYVSSPEEYQFLIHEIVEQDTYGFMQLARRYSIDYLINIGGNIGFTDLWFRLWYPDAQIVTIEPCPMTFQRLKFNTQNTSKIKLLNKAFGDGSDLYIAGHGGSGMCYTQSAPQGSPIGGVTLEEIFQDIPADATYYLKVDCEGGEKYLLHEKNLPYLLRADFVGIEYHPADRITPEEAVAIQAAVKQTHTIVTSTWDLETRRAGTEISFHQKYVSES